MTFVICANCKLVTRRYPVMPRGTKKGDIRLCTEGRCEFCKKRYPLPKHGGMVESVNEFEPIDEDPLEVLGKDLESY